MTRIAQICLSQQIIGAIRVIGGFYILQQAND